MEEWTWSGRVDTKLKSGHGVVEWARSERVDRKVEEWTGCGRVD